MIDSSQCSLSEAEPSHFGKSYNKGDLATVLEEYIVYQNVHINFSLLEKTKANLKNQIN